MIDTVRSLPTAADDAERIDRIRQFEELKSAISAAQLVEAAGFDSSQRVEQAKAGVPAARQGRGVAGQVALAMRVSPWYAARWLGWAKVLTAELPATFAALRAGLTNERRALLVAKETVWLSREDRGEVDGLVGPQLAGLSDARVEAEARRHAYRLDPAGACDRRRVAEGERRVTLRPRPDVMSSLTATLPVERGVAALAALRRHADSVIATGSAEGRTHAQVMADSLVELVTGQAKAADVPIEVELIMPLGTLLPDDVAGRDLAGRETVEALVSADEIDAMFDQLEGYLEDPLDHDDDPLRRDEDPSGGDDPPGDEPGELLADGIAPVLIPAPLARELVNHAPRAWLRRLFTSPGTGRLVTMETPSRTFTTGQRDYLRYRDRYCSTPFCGAPIRHADHARPVEQGGTTSLDNGNGKCAACNYAKQASGWRQEPTSGGTATLYTPTGHRYDISPPSPPGTGQRSPLERYARQLLAPLLAGQR